MKTMIYTNTGTTFAPVTASGKALAVFTKINDFLNVFFGASAEQDSNFRGLDMNGNPMWSRT